MTTSLISRIKNIKLILLDVDGVLTDGRIIYDSRGGDLKFFDVHDGMGVHCLKKAGIPAILVTAKGSAAILPRAKDMGVARVFSDVSPKTSVLPLVRKRFNVKDSELCFVGDDLVDIGIMKQVGFACAVRNACPEVKKAAHYVTARKGGRGAVREIAELILKTQGKWKEVIRAYEG